MHPSDDALITSSTSSFDDIGLPYGKARIQSVLILLYATVDAAAWLDVSGDADVSQRQFEAWVDKYLLPKAIHDEGKSGTVNAEEASDPDVIPLLPTFLGAPDHFPTAA